MSDQLIQWSLKRTGRCLCDLITWDDYSGGTHRGSCSRCAESPDVGCLDMDTGVGPDMHIHVPSMALWLEIADSLPRCEAPR